MMDSKIELNHPMARHLVASSNSTQRKSKGGREKSASRLGGSTLQRDMTTASSSTLNTSASGSTSIISHITTISTTGVSRGSIPANQVLDSSGPSAPTPTIQNINSAAAASLLSTNVNWARSFHHFNNLENEQAGKKVKSQQQSGPRRGVQNGIKGEQQLSSLSSFPTSPSLTAAAFEDDTYGSYGHTYPPLPTSSHGENKGQTFDRSHYLYDDDSLTSSLLLAPNIPIPASPSSPTSPSFSFPQHLPQHGHSFFHSHSHSHSHSYLSKDTHNSESNSSTPIPSSPQPPSTSHPSIPIRKRLSFPLAPITDLFSSIPLPGLGSSGSGSTGSGPGGPGSTGVGGFHMHRRKPSLNPGQQKQNQQGREQKEREQQQQERLKEQKEQKQQKQQEQAQGQQFHVGPQPERRIISYQGESRSRSTSNSSNTPAMYPGGSATSPTSATPRDRDRVYPIPGSRGGDTPSNHLSRAADDSPTDSTTSSVMYGTTSSSIGASGGSRSPYQPHYRSLGQQQQQYQQQQRGHLHGDLPEDISEDGEWESADFGASRRSRASTLSNSNSVSGVMSAIGTGTGIGVGGVGSVSTSGSGLRRKISDSKRIMKNQQASNPSPVNAPTSSHGNGGSLGMGPNSVVGTMLLPTTRTGTPASITSSSIGGTGTGGFRSPPSGITDAEDEDDDDPDDDDDDDDVFDDAPSLMSRGGSSQAGVSSMGSGGVRRRRDMIQQQFAQHQQGTSASSPPPQLGSPTRARSAITPTTPSPAPGSQQTATTPVLQMPILSSSSSGSRMLPGAPVGLVKQQISRLEIPGGTGAGDAAGVAALRLSSISPTGSTPTSSTPSQIQPTPSSSAGRTQQRSTIGGGLPTSATGSDEGSSSTGTASTSRVQSLTTPTPSGSQNATSTSMAPSQQPTPVQQPQHKYLTSQQRKNSSKVSLSSARAAAAAGGSAGTGSTTTAKPNTPVPVKDSSASNSASNTTTVTTTTKPTLLRTSSSTKTPRDNATGSYTEGYVAQPPFPDPTTSPNVPIAPASGMYWYKFPTYGHPHLALRAHTCTLVGSSIYVFGGCDRVSYNAMHVLDTDSMAWSKPPVWGEIPPPLGAMTTTAVGKRLVIFGGGDGLTYYNDVYVFDTVTGKYTKPHVTVMPGSDPAGPVRRKAHTACLYKTGIYIFGGGDGEHALDDVWRLDVSDWNKLTWRCICPSSTQSTNSSTGGRSSAVSRLRRNGPAPAINDPIPPLQHQSRPTARGYHTANMVGSKLIIYGGSDGTECFHDVWVFDVETEVWKLVPMDPPVPPGPQPPPPPATTALTSISPSSYPLANNKASFRRLSHTSTIVGSYLFVIGGHDGVEYSSDVLLLNLVTMQWDRRKVYGGKPSGRGYHASVLHDSRVFVVGGFDGVRVFGETYVLELAVSSYYSQISHFSIEV